MVDLALWQSKRTDALTRHVENVALMDGPRDPFAGAEALYATRVGIGREFVTGKLATTLPSV